MKKRKKYVSLLLALAMCLAMTACGSSDVADFDTITHNGEETDGYYTVQRDGDEIDVFIGHDREAFYLFYGDEEHALFDKAPLPTDSLYDQEEGDQDWELGTIDLSDWTGDGNSDLYVTLFHSDMSESQIGWHWEKDEGYVYQPDSSFFRVVALDPGEGEEYDFSPFAGLWVSEEEDGPYESIKFRPDGSWRLSSGGRVVEEGNLFYDEREHSCYLFVNYKTTLISLDESQSRLNLDGYGWFDYAGEADWDSGTEDSFDIVDGVLVKYYGSGWDVVIPDGVTEIGESAFENRGLASITIPDSVTSIGEYAFGGCSYLENVDIPHSVTNIGPGVFEGCYGFTSLEIPNSVTTIGESAFATCQNLTSVVIPDSVTTMGRHAFYFCTALTDVTIPGSVASIETSTFSYCSALTNVTIMDGVTSIGEYAFWQCASLTDVYIPDSVTSIGIWAFNTCPSLTSIFIPASVTSIEVSAFGDSVDGECGITDIYYGGSEEAWNAAIVGEKIDVLADITVHFNSVR